MKYIDEFRNPNLTEKLVAKINRILADYKENITLMEVCGTHTVAISRLGLRKILPSNLKLLSGPGCPVCITPNGYLDRVIAYSRMQDVIITTFGDMIKVPGSSSSLEKEKSRGADIKVVYSPIDALKIAEDNPEKKVIFLGVGFETTSPTVAATIKTAQRQNIKNFFVYSAHKVIPPAMKALLANDEVEVNGFICPGHVSTIIGARPYEFIPKEYNIPCVITGFESLDVIEGIFMLIKQVVGQEKPSVQIQYTRAVKEEGNEKAIEVINEVFEEENSNWRGLGVIPKSGLKIRKRFSDFDVFKNIEVKVEPTKENKQCMCGDVLRGVKNPLDCKLFKKACNPENPIGACMVSSEGACAAYYKYGE